MFLLGRFQLRTLKCGLTSIANRRDPSCAGKLYRLPDWSVLITLAEVNGGLGLPEQRQQLGHLPEVLRVFLVSDQVREGHVLEKQI